MPVHPAFATVETFDLSPPLPRRGRAKWSVRLSYLAARDHARIGTPTQDVFIQAREDSRAFSRRKADLFSRKARGRQAL
jgi:hypothetical protein